MDWPLSLWWILQLGTALAWLVGLVLAWNGRPQVAYVAAAASLGLGILLVVCVVGLPRDALGLLGQGDGFGLIGAILVGGTACCIAAAALGITALVDAVGRRYRAHALRKSAVPQ